MIAVLEDISGRVKERGILQHRGRLQEVVPDVACLRQPIVNLYFYGEAGVPSGSWVLIDAGLPLGAGQIIRAAAERYGPNSRPHAIILTHGHFDHVGALIELAQRWEVPIYAHALELPYLTGQASYPPGDPAVGGGSMAWLARFYPRGPIDARPAVQELPYDFSIPGMPGWRWIHTPGHSPGHVSLFRDTDRCLIAGDAFVTTRQESLIAALAQPQAVHGPPKYYTIDWQLARQSVETLAALEPEVAATGHGKPMAGPELQVQLHHLARTFEDEAVPEYGRYVQRPAIADENGVISTPPAVVNPRHAAVAVGVALLGTALMGYYSARKAERAYESRLAHR